MRVKKISAFIMAFVLCLSPFTLFSFAADISRLKDSGSPDISMMSMRSLSVDDVVSFSSSPSFELIDVPEPTFLDAAWGYQYTFTFRGLSAGSYSFEILGLNRRSSGGGVISDGVVIMDDPVISDSSSSYSFVLDSDSSSLSITVNFHKASSSVSPTYSDCYFYRIIPGATISSGYTYSSGVISNATRSIFNTINANFGSQPAGKYLINIYHWGDSYDVRFQMHDGIESVFYPTVTTGGVTTFVYNHSGGVLNIKGNFTASNDETSVVDGLIYGSGSSSNWVGGEIEANGPLSWVFNIKDIVAVPYELADDNNFGLFSPIIGFFRDQFSDMKSWIAIQIDKIAGDSETKSKVDTAASELEQEVNDLNTLHGQLDTQASTLEQQFLNDFSVPSEVAGQTANFQLMYSGIFSSLGVFSIFIWLPVVLAVIKKLLRL